MPVIAAQPQHFADDAAARLALDMDNVIDGFSDFGLDVLEGSLGVAAENEVRKAAQRLCGRVGVNGGKRS